MNTDAGGPDSDGAEDEGEDGVLSAAQQAEAFAALARLRTAGLVSPDHGRGKPAPVAAALAVLRGEFDVVDDVTLSSEAKATAAATTFGLSHPRKVLEYVALLGQLANRKPVQAVAVAGGGAAAMAAAGAAAASPLATLGSAPEAGQQPQQHDGVEEEQDAAPTEEERRSAVPAHLQGAAEASRASEAAARAVEVLASMPAMPPTKVAKLLSAGSPPTLARVVQPARLATAIPASAASL